MPHVYSRLANSVTYTEWKTGGGDLPVKGREVTIKGGTGVASKHLITPLGVVTSVTDEEAEFLANDHHFQQHKSNGFVKIEKTKHEIEAVVADMGDAVDKSSPLTPSSFEDAEEQGIPAVSGAKSKSKKK